MKQLICAWLVTALLAGSLFAQQVSTTPVPRDEGWKKRVEREGLCHLG